MLKLPNFSSNKKCWMILNKLVFGPDTCCPVCKQALRPSYQSRYLWCSHCRRKYRFGSFKGSWLYGMKLTPRQLFILIWCWQNKKSPDTARLLALVSYTSVNRWYDRFRQYIPPDAIEQLSVLVQIDESYFGKLKSKQPQTIVVGAIEPDTRKVALKITNSRSRDVLEEFVLDNIRQDTLVVSDKWYGYEELGLLGYDHEAWNHSQGHFSGTNQIEGLWSCIKRYLKKLYGCIPTNKLELVLNEWMARLNRPSWFSSPEDYLRVAFVPC